MKKKYKGSDSYQCYFRLERQQSNTILIKIIQESKIKCYYKTTFVLLLFSIKNNNNKILLNVT